MQYNFWLNWYINKPGNPCKRDIAVGVLSQQDIVGIQALYGARGQPVAARGGNVSGPVPKRSLESETNSERGVIGELTDDAVARAKETLEQARSTIENRPMRSRSGPTEQQGTAQAVADLIGALDDVQSLANGNRSQKREP